MDETLANFTDLIRRVRAGDDRAVAELVRHYEPLIRRSIRLRLRDPRLRRVLDSTDICQAVLASFCLRASLGQFELREPEQLRKLLQAMARYKLTHHIDMLRARRRDYRRDEPLSASDPEPIACEDTPSQMAANRELIREIRTRLSTEECRIVELRDAGRDWASIAAELGGTPDGRRMQLTRAISRIAGELQLDLLS